MALKLHYFASGETQGLEKCGSVVGTPTVSNTNGIDGKYAYVLAAGANEIAFTTAASSGHDLERIDGFYIRFSDATPAANVAFFDCSINASGGYNNYNLLLNTSGDLLVRDGNDATIRTITTPFTDATWHRVEIYSTGGDPGTIEVFIDGASQGSDSGQDLLDSRSNGITFKNVSGSGTSIEIQHCYAYSGTTNADRLSGASGTDDWEVTPFYGDASSTITGDTPDTGTFDKIQQIPFVETAGNVVGYTSVTNTDVAGDIEADTGSGAGPSGSGIGTIYGMGTIWRAKKIIGIGASQALFADTLLVQTNLTGSITDIDDNPYSPDGNWLTATGKSVCRVGFPTPDAPPETGAGLQSFTVLLRKSGLGGDFGNEELSPDGIGASDANLSGDETTISNDADTAPDGNWRTASSNNTTSVCHTTFPTPTANPKTGASLQNFKIYARLTANGTPATYNVYLLENGTRINGGSPIATGTLSTTTGTLIVATWDATLLGTADGSLVECEFEVIKTGGSPTSRTTGEVNAVEWNCEYAGTEETVDYAVKLYENGSEISAAGSQTGTLTNAGGDTIVTFTWDAINLGTADGSLIECHVEQTDTSPTVYMEVGAFRCIIDFDYVATDFGFLRGNDVDGVTAELRPSIDLTASYANFQHFDEATTIVPTDTENVRVGIDRNGNTNEFWCSDALASLLSKVVDSGITASPDLLLSIAADLKAKGKLDATLGGADIFISATADLVPMGYLTAIPDLVFSATADLKVDNQLASSPLLAFSTLADLDAEGKLDAVGNLIFSSTADLDARGKLDASVQLLFSTLADLEARGQLSVSDTMLFSAAADLKGQGKLDTTSALIFSLAANLQNASTSASPITATAAMAITGAANLLADGKLDAAASLLFSTSADLLADGKLDATPSMVFSQQADLSAYGKLDASDILLFSTLADLNADGQLTASPNIVVSVVADISSINEIAATPDMVFSLLADLKSKAGMSATPSLVFSANADIQSTNRINATPTMIFSAAADLEAYGKLDAATSLALSLTIADLLARGSLGAATDLTFLLSATLTADGALASTPSMVFSALADIHSTNEINASDSLVFDVSAAIGGDSSVAAYPSLVFSAAADLEAEGKLDSTAALILSATADLNATGTLESTANLVLTLVADLKAHGKLDAGTSLLFSATADLIATGDLNATSALIFSIAADLEATGVMASTAAMLFSAAADLKAFGQLDASDALAFSATADLVDIGSYDLNASPALLFSLAADLKSDGKLDATSSMILDAVADLQGYVRGTATAPLAFSVTADLKGPAAIDATAALALSMIADLKGGAALSAATSMLFSGNAAIAGIDNISAIAPLTFSVVADLQGGSSLSATAPMTFSGAADLKGEGQLDALASLVFSSFATLSDVNAAIFIHIAIAAAIRKIKIKASTRTIEITASDKTIDIEALN